MRSTKRLLTAALAATALFAALATTGSARRFSVSNTNIRAVFRPVIFQGFEGTTLSCTLTLEGTFHYRTFIKVERTLIGYITRAIFATETCVAGGGFIGRPRVLTETLPWHVRYVSFEGGLPSVTLRVRILNFSFDMIGGPTGTCKYLFSPDFIVGGPAGGSINEGTGNSTITAATNSITGRPFCPERNWVARTVITVLGSATPITITLI
jgi:hypothetical protein